MGPSIISDALLDVWQRHSIFYITFSLHCCKTLREYRVEEMWVLIQYQGKDEEVSSNTVGCSLELPGLYLGQYLLLEWSPEKSIAQFKRTTNSITWYLFVFALVLYQNRHIWGTICYWKIIYMITMKNTDTLLHLCSFRQWKFCCSRLMLFKKIKSLWE